MTILELQQSLADDINANIALVDAGCRAFAEDALDVMQEVQRHLAESRGVVIIVTTPEFTRNAQTIGGATPVEARLDIRCVEKPAVNRCRANAITAMDAANEVRKTVERQNILFDRIRETPDYNTGTVTASVTFNTCIHMT